jgi:hypothetical protein
MKNYHTQVMKTDATKEHNNQHNTNTLPTFLVSPSNFLSLPKANWLQKHSYMGSTYPSSLSLKKTLG